FTPVVTTIRRSSLAYAVQDVFQPGDAITSGYVPVRCGASPNGSTPLSGTTFTPGPTSPGGSSPTFVDVSGRLAEMRSATTHFAQPVRLVRSAAAVAASAPHGTSTRPVASLAASCAVVIPLSL